MEGKAKSKRAYLLQALVLILVLGSCAWLIVRETPAQKAAAAAYDPGRDGGHVPVLS